MRSLFARTDTFDFEVGMKALASTADMLTAYGGQQSLLIQVESDQACLKEALITAISNTHPEFPFDVGSQQYLAVRRFLRQFASVFTVNYDLLFYWARNQWQLRDARYATDDGFRDNACWRGYGTDPNVYFLHGGLHLYEAKAGTRKHVFDDNGGSITYKVRRKLVQGVFPLFVTEPTSQRKMRRIEQNPYLHFCFRALGELSDDLFVYGHSIAGTDRHLFNAIGKSGVTRVFVSLFGDEYSPNNVATMANALAFMRRSGREVLFYDAASAQVWGLTSVGPPRNVPSIAAR